MVSGLKMRKLKGVTVRSTCLSSSLEDISEDCINVINEVSIKLATGRSSGEQTCRSRFREFQCFGFCRSSDESLFWGRGREECSNVSHDPLFLRGIGKKNKRG